MSIRIYAFIQMYNEKSSGHLKRCLENCKLWADDIIIYDDKSTDDSVEFAKKYTNNIILGEKNEWGKETYNKQKMLNYIHNLDIKPHWILWIDCDEILDKHTILNIREFCKKNINTTPDAYTFQQINLWRGERYYRTDGVFYNKKYNGSHGWFVRLWKYKNDLKIEQKIGGDHRLYPININIINDSDFKVIHYGFSNYKKLLKHIGVHNNNLEQLKECANGNVYVTLANSGIEWAKRYVVNGKGVPNMFLDEINLTCEYIPDDWFPDSNIPTKNYDKPNPLSYNELKIYDDIED